MQTQYWMIALVLAWGAVTATETGVGYAQEAAGHAEVTSADEVHAEDAHATDEHGIRRAEGEHADVNPVTLDPDLAIVTAIIFLVLLIVLWKFAWGPIVEALDKRERTVADQLAEAKRSQDESTRLLADHETRLAGAASEIKQLLDQARRDADVQKHEIIESAQAAATAEKDRAVREIHAAKNAALQDLAKKSVDTAVDLAGKIVKRDLNNDDHSNLIDDAIQRFSDN